MAADETITPQPAEQPAPEPAEFRRIGPLAAAKIAGDDVQANLSAIATVTAGSLSATGSAIGVASVDGDAALTASMAPLVLTRGDTTVQQSYVSAVIVGSGGNTKVHQAFAPLIIGKTVDLSQAGGAALVAGEANVKNSWVGVVLSPTTNVSEDSHVIVSTKAAIIIALALFGGLGLVALAVTLGVKRVMRWRPTIGLPSLPNLPKNIDLAAIQERWQQHQHHHRRSA